MSQWSQLNGGFSGNSPLQDLAGITGSKFWCAVGRAERRLVRRARTSQPPLNPLHAGRPARGRPIDQQLRSRDRKTMHRLPVGQRLASRSFGRGGDPTGRAPANVSLPFRIQIQPETKGWPTPANASGSWRRMDGATAAVADHGEIAQINLIVRGGKRRSEMGVRTLWSAIGRQKKGGRRGHRRRPLPVLPSGVRRRAGPW